jgi:DNA polymerase bacteriophage-type
MTILSLDVESRSAVDLKKAGAHRYWEDETTSLWCACYAFDDEPVQTWLPGQPCPPRIAAHVAAGGTISGWNVSFERLAWRHCLAPRHGWPVAALEQFEDTAAAGAAMGLPRGLGDAAKAMGLDEEKDGEGHRLMLRMSKPRAPRKNEPPGLYWWDDQERIDRLVAYCARDVEAERALRKVLVPLSPAEREVYLLDQRINDRGVAIDVKLVNALLKIVDEALAGLDRRMAEVTGYQVRKCSEVARLMEWLQSRGVRAESLAKASLEDLLLDVFMPEEAREAIEIRKEAAKTSTAKLKAMLACVCEDGRARGLHLYHGAGTGRWAGKLIQTQNMPRGTGTVKDPEAAAPDFLLGSAQWIDLVYGSPMSAVSDTLRSCLCAGPGKRFIAADFSAIEGRVTAWLAGEKWKLEAFRANDEGRGAGIYELTAAGILNKDVATISKSERQAYGKVPELALGFQGGVSAFHSMARIYNVDMADAYEPLQGTAGTETWGKAERRYAECLERGDSGTDVMTERAWVASEVTKVLWRAKHPAVAALWKGLEEAAFDAVARPGVQFGYRLIEYVVKRDFLWCRLPSGRVLAYGAPRIREQETPWGEKRPAVTALGVDSVTKKWRRFGLYGGLATENVVQAVARDLLVHGMLTAERAGYPIVLHIHDEAVAEVPDDFGSVAEFEALLCDAPAWAEGLPYVASGYEARRFKKD